MMRRAAPRQPKPTPKRVGTKTCAAVAAGLASRPVRPIQQRRDNGVALLDVHWATLFENSPRNHRSLGDLPLDHLRPPLEIGYRIAAPSRFVVHLGAGFVWHVR
jgi:hypothetical protein